jgi:hypothetical protein
VAPRSDVGSEGEGIGSGLNRRSATHPLSVIHRGLKPTATVGSSLRDDFPEVLEKSKRKTPACFHFTTARLRERAANGGGGDRSEMARKLANARWRERVG